MNAPLITIGINASHDASVCLMEADKIVFAISEERLNKQKHYQGIPLQGLKQCLHFLNQHHHDTIHSIVVNNILTENYDEEIKALFQGFTILNYYKNPSHHLLHCLYAIAICPEKTGVVIIADGSGNSYGEYLRNASPLIGSAPEYHDCYESISTYYFNEDELVVNDKLWGLWVENTERYFRFPSLGHMYGLAAQHIFGDWQAAGKVMGLAPFGNEEQVGVEMIQIENDVLTIQTDWVLSIKPISNHKSLEKDEIASSLAAKVQHELQKAMLFIARNLWKKYQVPTLCISGGVGLNTVCNSYISEHSEFENIVVTPAAGDNGVAIGAALYAYWRRTSKILRISDYSEFMGFQYETIDIKLMLQACSGIRFTQLSQQKIIEEAAFNIYQGKVVGWFEGKSEFGPRALGHRSILANPMLAQMPTILNRKVKFREEFRPFAVSVLEENATAFFQTEKASPWMMFVVDVIQYQQSLIPAAAHVDGTCRIQTVSKQYNGIFRQLIEKFHELSSIPLVMNTSLNLKGMPISETPLDAIDCLLKSDMDVLYMETFRIEKIDYDTDWNDLLERMVYLRPDILLYHKQYFINKELTNEYGYKDITTGYNFILSFELYKMLSHVDGHTPLYVLCQYTDKETIINHFFTKGVLVI